MFEGGAAAKCARPSWISHRSAWRTATKKKLTGTTGIIVSFGPLTLRTVSRASTTATSRLMKRTLGTEVLHHCNPPLQKVTLRRHEGSIFGEYGCSELGILLNESVSKGVSERANGCFVSSLAGTRRAGHTDDEHTREKR